MIGMAAIYWLQELQWAWEEIRKAKTPEIRELAIEYHKDICQMGRK